MKLSSSIRLRRGPRPWPWMNGTASFEAGSCELRRDVAPGVLMGARAYPWGSVLALLLAILIALPLTFPPRGLPKRNPLKRPLRRRKERKRPPWSRRRKAWLRMSKRHGRKWPISRSKLAGANGEDRQILQKQIVDRRDTDHLGCVRVVRQCPETGRRGPRRVCLQAESGIVVEEDLSNDQTIRGGSPEDRSRRRGKSENLWRPKSLWPSKRTWPRKARSSTNCTKPFATTSTR